MSATGRARLWMAAGVVAFAAAALALGPRVDFEDRWVEPALSADLDAYLERREAEVADLRPGDAKGIVWREPETHRVTPLALVYIHGFSADRHEVEPLVSELGRDLDANVYFTRLAGHGRDEAAMGETTVEAWLNDAAEAVAIGGRIGERVVVMGTSTGGTLALWAAARKEARGRLAVLVLISPNLGLQDKTSELLLWPWGGALARLIVGPERCFQPKNDEHARHWTECYPTKALLPMMALVDHVRSLAPGSVTVPTLVIYSRDDEVVDTSQTVRVMARLAATPPDVYVVEGSTDPEHHVVAGAITSPETTEAARARILEFLAPFR